MSTKKRGFASMDPERRLELARKGGLSVKPEDRPFAKDKRLASRAGKKGGPIGGKISKPRVPPAQAVLPWLGAMMASEAVRVCCVSAICIKDFA